MLDPATLLVHRRAQFLAAIMEEILQPLVALEADQVVFQQGRCQPLVKRQRGEQPRRGPRDMQEKPDPVGDPAHSQPLTQRHQVIIVDPD